MKLAAKDLVASVQAEEQGGWSWRQIDGFTIQIVAPRYYADGDAIELLARTDDDELVISDGGETIARLEMVGVNVTTGRLRDAMNSLLRAHRADYRQGNITMRGPWSQAPVIVRSMLDALAGLDGLRALAPTPRELQFADKLVTYLEAEFPQVEERPTLVGESGSAYRLTATAKADDRLVYIQAVAGNSPQSRRTAVEHAYTTFSDIDGTLLPDRKLIVVGGETGQWAENRLRLLARIAFVGTWSARERFTRFIWGEIPESKLMLGSEEQLALD